MLSKEEYKLQNVVRDGNILLQEITKSVTRQKMLGNVSKSFFKEYISNVGKIEKAYKDIEDKIKQDIPLEDKVNMVQGYVDTVNIAGSMLEEIMKQGVE